MATLNSAVNVVVAMFGLLGLLGGAFAVFRNSFLSASLNALRGDRDDLITRVQILEDDSTLKDAKIGHLEQQLNTERDARKVLETVVTGKEELEAIISMLDAHHKSVDKWQANHDQKTSDLLKLLGSKRGGDLSG